MSDQVPRVGDVLSSVLDVLGIPQTVMAAESKISAKHLNQLIRGHVTLTPETAIQLADAIALRLVAIDTRQRMEALRQTEARHHG